MDLQSLATKLLMKKLGNNSNSSSAESALGELIGSGSNFNLADMVGQFTGRGDDIAAKAKSWLGDGANESISTDQLKEVLSAEKLEAFANKLGIGQDEASSTLSDVLPQLVDKASKGGTLLDSIGGGGGLLKLVSKLFK